MNTQAPMMSGTSPKVQTPGSSGPPATINGSHPVGSFLNRLVSAPADARIVMSLGEFATTVDRHNGDSPAVVAVGSINLPTHAGQCAVGLASLWGRWGRPTVLIDLASGSKSVTGAVPSTSPDLAGACEAADSGTGLSSISRLHVNLANTGVIATGKADVVGLISNGRLARLVAALSRSHQRIVLCAPQIATGFPFLSLSSFSDRLALALQHGRSRSGPVSELAEQAMKSGLRPIDIVWFD